MHHLRHSIGLAGALLSAIFGPLHRSPSDVSQQKQNLQSCCRERGNRSQNERSSDWQADRREAITADHARQLSLASARTDKALARASRFYVHDTANAGDDNSVNAFFDGSSSSDGRDLRLLRASSSDDRTHTLKITEPGNISTRLRGIDPSDGSMIGRLAAELHMGESTVRAALRAGMRRGLSSLSDQLHLLALIWQESRGYARARSHAGALGLMQLMPDTARRIAGALGMAYHRSLLFVRDYNVTLGTTLLAYLRNKYHGNMAAAEAAYNEGEPALDHQLSQSSNGVIHTNLETQNYVQTIEHKVRQLNSSIMSDYYDSLAAQS